MRQHGPKVTGSPDVWYPVLLVVAGILFFADPLFSSKNFYFRDILNFHYPLRKVLIESYARGEFPLWNPYVYLGQPMLANPNYMAFYPTNLFHLFLPFNYAFKLHFIVHPLLGGLGIYFLQRRLGIVPLAALGGSVVYQFSGTVLSFLNLYNIVPAVALMPWTGWAFVGALKKHLVRGSLLCGAIFGLQFVAFEPLMFQSTLLLVAGLALFHVLESQDRVRASVQALGTAGIGLAIGLALAAVQVIPTLQLLPLSARASSIDLGVQSSWSMHPADFLNVVVPNLFGSPYTMYRTNYWGELYHEGREPYLVSFFLGTGTVLLALLSFFSPRKKLQRTIMGVMLLSSLLAVGKLIPIYSWIYTHVPFFRLGRYPSKYFLAGALCVAILSAIGLELLLTQEAQRRQRTMMLGIGGAILAVMLIGAWVYLRANTPHLESLIRARLLPGLAATKDLSVITPQLMDSVRLSGTFLLLLSVLMCVYSRGKRIPYLGQLIILILGAELASSNLRLTPLLSDTDLNFSAEVNSYLQNTRRGEPYRVVSIDSLRSRVPLVKLSPVNRSWAWMTFFYRMSGQPMYGIMNRIQYSLDQTVDYLNTQESHTLAGACFASRESACQPLLRKLNTPVVLTLQEIQDSRPRLLASFEALATTRLNVYELEGALPRAYFVAGVEGSSSHEDALHKFVWPDFPYASKVILEGSRVLGKEGKAEPGEARVLDYQSARVVCDVQAKVSGHLVLLDSYYPGWRAYVDGGEVRILRANYAFRAVEVGAGNHRVEFIYRPRSFYLGLWVSSVALLSGVVSLFWRPRQKVP